MEFPFTGEFQLVRGFPEFYASPTWYDEYVNKFAAETGEGVEAVLSLLASLVKADEGSGIDASSLLAALVKADTGSGVDASTLLAALEGAETGSGVEASSLLASLAGADTGEGEDRYAALISHAAKGGDMKLPPGGKVSI